MPNLETVLEHLSTQLESLEGEERTGSRFAGQRADRSFTQHIAEGGSATTYSATGTGAARVVASTTSTRANTGIAFLHDVRNARRGDADAHRRLAKSWVEGVDSSGGFLVPPEQLGGYVPAFRAAAPLPDRCARHRVSTNEVWIVTEGNSVSVVHTAESATKINTTGSVGQKISTIFKLAGTSTLSDEVIADTNYVVSELVGRQLGQQIGIALDTAVINGNGVGQPTGVRQAAGVSATAVDGQGGRALFDSILKAISRIVQRHEPVDSVVLHPRDAVKFDLEFESGAGYVFPEGIARRLPDGVDLVLDSNIPTSLGTGTNESIFIVGGFRRGAYYFERQPLTLDASSDAAFTTDETIYRAVLRYGFAVVVPGAFEILTGILP